MSPGKAHPAGRDFMKGPPCAITFAAKRSKPAALLFLAAGYPKRTFRSPRRNQIALNS